MDFVVVTATRDATESVKKCVESVRKYTEGDYLHIITDDSSLPPTLKYLKGLNHIKLLEYSGDDNPHLQRVLKSAFDYAFTLNPKYIFTVESDVYVTEGWSGRLVKVLDERPDAAGVTCVTVDRNLRLNHPMRNDLPQPYRKIWSFDPKFDKVIEMQKHLTFSCTAFKTKVCKEVDFCEENRIAGVDIRYSQQLRGKGYKLYVDMGLYVFHPSPHSSRREWRRRTNRPRMK